MRKSSRYFRIGLLLLGVTSVLWITAALFLFRIANIFDAYLMKFPGPLVVFGAMLVCPLVATYFGIRMIRTRQNRPAGWLFASVGTLLFVAFVVVIGVPMLVSAMTPETPKNPSTPRPFETQVGLPVFPGAEAILPVARELGLPSCCLAVGSDVLVYPRQYRLLHDRLATIPPRFEQETFPVRESTHSGENHRTGTVEDAIRATENSKLKSSDVF